MLPDLVHIFKELMSYITISFQLHVLNLKLYCVQGVTVRLQRVATLLCVSEVLPDN
ncbi:hypothetical protein DPMN_012030 [Dreissena polymorpha]|uniref:Uncharacterized protein n=1 Tax=Dreissena polymorpha TaxID=45954 RepID=A0A9D4N685_DREPO|nr:hypothetical protein DPMN_012030 [Dreissena polymorpha]